MSCPGIELCPHIRRLERKQVRVEEVKDGFYGDGGLVSVGFLVGETIENAIEDDEISPDEKEFRAWQVQEVRTEIESMADGIDAQLEIISVEISGTDQACDKGPIVATDEAGIVRRYCQSRAISAQVRAVNSDIVATE